MCLKMRHRIGGWRSVLSLVLGCDPDALTDFQALTALGAHHRIGALAIPMFVGVNKKVYTPLIYPLSLTFQFVNVTRPRVYSVP